MRDLKERTKKFALNCSSSIGANDRASQRAKSTADFLNKLKIVEEEVDESMYPRIVH